MRTARGFHWLLLTALLGTVGSCSDGSGPDDGTKPPSELNVVRVSPNSTPLFNSSASFYAKQGEDRQVSIFFQDEAGMQGGEYLRLEVNAQSLLALPNGTPVLPGDSVLIHVNVVDPAQMLFELTPSGLQFNPLEPARLKIHYDHAEGDLNHDGTVNGEDDAVEGTLSIWRQEQLGDPFVRLTSILSIELDEAEADLLGFSRYALAY
jgi:hypothetical protein